MSIFFNAIRARALSKEANSRNTSRLEDIAMTTVNQLVIPRVKEACSVGLHVVDINFHPTQEATVRRAGSILACNGYHVFVFATKRFVTLSVRW